MTNSKIPAAAVRQRVNDTVLQLSFLHRIGKHEFPSGFPADKLYLIESITPQTLADKIAKDPDLQVVKVYAAWLKNVTEDMPSLFRRNLLERHLQRIPFNKLLDLHQQVGRTVTLKKFLLGAIYEGMKDRGGSKAVAGIDYFVQMMTPVYGMKTRADSAEALGAAAGIDGLVARMVIDRLKALAEGDDIAKYEVLLPRALLAVVKAAPQYGKEVVKLMRDMGKRALRPEPRLRVLNILGDIARSYPQHDAVVLEALVALAPKSTRVTSSYKRTIASHGQAILVAMQARGEQPEIALPAFIATSPEKPKP